jgi:hypothetical protein
MMQFEPKISGVKVTDFEIEPIFMTEVVTLMEVNYNIKKQEVMNWILDHLRFFKGAGGNWICTMDYDTIYKITIWERYPEYEKELTDYFGENWFKYYIRFNH